MTIEQIKKELKGFTDENGKIFQMPTKTKKELMVAVLIADKIEPEKIYAEKEINELILTMISFDDYCTVRRDLIDFGFMTRNGGAQYCLSAKKPDLSAYGLTIE